MGCDAPRAPMGGESGGNRGEKKKNKLTLKKNRLAPKNNRLNPKNNRLAPRAPKDGIGGKSREIGL